jgi:prepilin-type N-terminal cleavage/methylation domain-containing protein
MMLEAVFSMQYCLYTGRRFKDMPRPNKKGFTILELMIATTVFTFMFVAVTAGILYIGKLYQKGISSSRSQEAARNLTSVVGNMIEYSSQPPTLFPKGTDLPGSPGTPSNFSAICSGRTRLSYDLSRSVGGGQQSVWLDTMANESPCGPVNLSNPYTAYGADGQPSGSDGVEILPEGMRLEFFNLSAIPTTNLWSLDALVVFGDSDLFIDVANGCKSTALSGQFCGLARAQTSFYKRVQ